MILAASLLAALSLQAQVFPEPLCENLPEVSPEVKSWVAQVAPELAQVRVRELPESTALDVFRRAAASGWGSIDVLTHGVFREPCTFYLSGQALRAVDAVFDLDLLTVIRGQDRKGQDFEMAAILAGRGKLVVFYDRDGIVYRNERLDRDFKLASRVEFDTPVAGVLENVHGLCAKILLFGCVRIRSIVKVADTIEVRAGTFTSESPLKPIQAREGRAGQAPAPRAATSRMQAPSSSDRDGIVRSTLRVEGPTFPMAWRAAAGEVRWFHDHRRFPDVSRRLASTTLPAVGTGPPRRRTRIAAEDPCSRVNLARNRVVTQFGFGGG